MKEKQKKKIQWGNIMKKKYLFKKLFLLIFCMIFIFLNLQPVFAYKTENSAPSAFRFSDIDNSDLQVKVIQRIGNENEVIFTGRLGDFDEGKWKYVDFNTLDVLTFFNWTSEESFSIIPIQTEDGSSSVNNISDNGILTVSQAEIDTAFYNENGYTEKSLNGNLIYEVTLTNNSVSEKCFTPVFAVYTSDGILKNMYMGNNTAVSVGQSKSALAALGAANVSNGDTVKAMVWDMNTSKPYIRTQVLFADMSDSYGGSTDEATLITDIDKWINGKIQDTDDTDYIKFTVPESGNYSVLCLNSSDISVQLIDDLNNYVSDIGEYISADLLSGKKYYIKINSLNSNTGEYTVVIGKTPSDNVKSFYDYDIEIGKYKDLIMEYGNDLYSSDTESAKELYEKYARIETEDRKLHKLPDILKNIQSSPERFDELVETYYKLKSEEFENLTLQYKELLKSYGIETENPAVEDEAFPITVYPPVLTRNNVYSEQTVDMLLLEENEDSIEPYGNSLSSPSLTIKKKTEYSVTFNVRFPDNNGPCNYIYLYDFNTDDGLSLWKKAVLKGNNQSSSIVNGEYEIQNLVPGGIYIIHMVWSYDGQTYGGVNSICERVQLPDNTNESLKTQKGQHIDVTIREDDYDKIDSNKITTWIGNMDKVYGALKDFTGYTPYNGENIEIKSTDQDLNQDQPNGQNYWRVIMGVSGNPILISRPFFNSHMKRLKANDWGDTVIHELSHNFDRGRWNFDPEALAFLKTAYIIDKLDARVYRIDTALDNIPSGWYQKGQSSKDDVRSYYQFLEEDWFEGYNNSFGQGYYLPAGMAAILVRISNQTGWEPFSETFKEFNKMSENQIPTTEIGKLNLFLSLLKKYSNKDVLSLIDENEKNIIADKFNGELQYVNIEVPEIPKGVSGRKINVHVSPGEYCLYQFKPETDANYTIQTSPYGDTGLNNDTYIEIFEDENMIDAPIAENDDFGDSKFSKISMDMQKDTVYYIKVRNANPNAGMVHAALTISQTSPDRVLSIDSPVDITVSDTEFALMKFTPSEDAEYTFYADKHENANDTYLKLYENEDLSQMIAQNNNKIILKLEKDKTYYLQFSGFFMKSTSADVGVRRAHTIEFKKRTDSSFIYVNNPEYISRWDIVDDTDSQHLKTFEQKDVMGKNTYYQTHLTWFYVGDNANSVPQKDSFYSGIDFYNPNDYSVNVSIKNLVYTNNKTEMSNYINKTGENLTISIPPKSHAQLFDYTNNKLQNFKEEFLGIFIIFDFEVTSSVGGSIPQSEGITVSALAAYDYENMRLKDGTENTLIYGNHGIDSGDIIYDGRPNEAEDLFQKYKGIARNQAYQIDVNIELALDEYSQGAIPLALKDSGNLINGYYPVKQTDWNVQINPLNDSNEALLHTTPDNLHSFTYHYDGNKQWIFDFKHRDTRKLTLDDNTSVSINEPVPESIVNQAKSDILNGIKSFSGSPDEYALQMGSWGVTYHYTITAYNAGSSSKSVKFRLKPHAHYTLCGKRSDPSEYYVFKDNGKCLNYWIPFDNEEAEIIEPNSCKTFEIVTMSALGEAGLENTIIIE